MPNRLSIRSMRHAGLALALAACGLPAAQAATVIAEGYNVGTSPTPNIPWDTPAATDIGWYWTPSSSFPLTGIETNFGSTDGRSVTVEILNDRGAVAGGGTVLASGSYTPSSGVLSGVTFSTPFNVTAGTRYFVGFKGTAGLGINVTGLLSTEPTYTTGATLPPNGYEDAGDGNFETEFTGGVGAQSGTCGGLDCPILAFETSSAGTATAGPALVASTLPSSRSAVVGETVTVFATVINASNQVLDSCSVSLSGFPVTVDYVKTDPATNQTEGAADTPFPLAVGAAQSLLLSLTPSAVLAPTNLPLIFGCSGAEPAASVSGLDTVLLSAATTAPPDIVALSATPSADGTVRMNGINAPQAFGVASVNVGADATLTVSADTGGSTLPLSLSICQTNPSTGACLAPAAASVTLDIAANATPTFGIFLDSSAAIPFSPATTRVFVRFEDAAKVERGATSVAVTNGATVATAPTGGGIYLGTLSISSGPATGQSLQTVFIVSETGQIAGANAASLTTPVLSLFTGNLAVNTSLGFAASGELIAAPGKTLPDGSSLSALTMAGTLSPQSFISGQFTAPAESGVITGSYNAGLYQRSVSLGLFTGSWNLRDATSVTGTFQFQANGSFTGTGTGVNNAGCQYAGQLSIPNGNFNAESVSLTITGCALAGSYSGLSALYDFLSTNDTVVFGLSSGTEAQVSRLTRF